MIQHEDFNSVIGDMKSRQCHWWQEIKRVLWVAIDLSQDMGSRKSWCMLWVKRELGPDMSVLDQWRVMGGWDHGRVMSRWDLMRVMGRWDHGRVMCGWDHGRVMGGRDTSHVLVLWSYRLMNSVTGDELWYLIISRNYWPLFNYLNNYSGVIQWI